MSKPRRLSIDRARRFCEALKQESERRAIPWWAPIARIADRLGISEAEAIVLADDCERAGYARHDRSHLGETARKRALPHSVTIAAAGWELLSAPPKLKRR